MTNRSSAGISLLRQYRDRGLEGIPTSGPGGAPFAVPGQNFWAKPLGGLPDVASEWSYERKAAQTLVGAQIGRFGCT